ADLDPLIELAHSILPAQGSILHTAYVRKAQIVGLPFFPASSDSFVSACGCHRARNERAARASSGRLIGAVRGASCNGCGFSSISRSTATIASTNSSSISTDSVSVGSTIIASSTTRGQYTVGGRKPESIN